MLTSLRCFKYFWIIFDHFSGHRVPADPRRTNEDEDLPGEGSHLLHGLIELQVRRVHLGVFPEVIWKPLFLLLLKLWKVQILRIDNASRYQEENIICNADWSFPLTVSSFRMINQTTSNSKQTWHQPYDIQNTCSKNQKNSHHPKWIGKSNLKLDWAFNNVKPNDWYFVLDWV